MMHAIRKGIGEGIVDGASKFDKVLRVMQQTSVRIMGQSLSKRHKVKIAGVALFVAIGMMGWMFAAAREFGSFQANGMRFLSSISHDSNVRWAREWIRLSRA